MLAVSEPVLIRNCSLKQYFIQTSSCHFSVAGAHLGYHITFNRYVSLVSSALRQFLGFCFDSLDFDDLDSCEGYWSGILYNVPQFGYVLCFSHDQAGVMCYWEGAHRVRCHSHHTISRVNTIAITYTTDVNFDHLT